MPLKECKNKGLTISKSIRVVYRVIYHVYACTRHSFSCLVWSIHRILSNFPLSFLPYDWLCKLKTLISKVFIKYLYISYFFKVSFHVHCTYLYNQPDFGDEIQKLYQKRTWKRFLNDAKIFWLFYLPLSVICSFHAMLSCKLPLVKTLIRKTLCSMSYES